MKNPYNYLGILIFCLGIYEFSSKFITHLESNENQFSIWYIIFHLTLSFSIITGTIILIKVNAWSESLNT